MGCFRTMKNMFELFLNASRLWSVLSWYVPETTSVSRRFWIQRGSCYTQRLRITATAAIHIPVYIRAFFWRGMIYSLDFFQPIHHCSTFSLWCVFFFLFSEGCKNERPASVVCYLLLHVESVYKGHAAWWRLQPPKMTMEMDRFTHMGWVSIFSYICLIRVLALHCFKGGETEDNALLYEY